MRSQCASVTAMGGGSILLRPHKRTQPAVFSIAVPNGRETPIFKQGSLGASSSNQAVFVGRSKPLTSWRKSLTSREQARYVRWGGPRQQPGSSESGPDQSCFTLALISPREKTRYRGEASHSRPTAEKLAPAGSLPST